MSMVLVTVLAGVGTLALAGAAFALARSRVRVDADHALVITKLGRERVVRFTDTTVLPLVQRGELVDLAVKRIVVSRRGREGLICADHIRVDAEVTFMVRVNRTVDDVLRVAEAVGAQRAGCANVLEELFAAKLADALETVAAQLEFRELHAKRELFKDEVIQVIGKDLNGYTLDDAAIDYLEQTPIEHLDPNNILDAQGIRKIRELTNSALHGVELPPAKAESFAQRLADQGLLDIDVGIEVTCNVATERALSGRVADHRSALSRFVAPAHLDAIADAEIACAGGKAAVRFATYATEHQVLIAARVVHALKRDSPVFR